MTDLINAFYEVLSISSLLALIVGVLVGIIFGAIPGLSATMGVAIFLPVTFGFDAVTGILLLIGVYLGGISGGLIAATLIGIPGTPSSVATTFDAYPMSKNGEPARALGIGIVGSLFGSIFGFLILIAFAPVIARFAVRLGPVEYFALIFFAIILISVLSRGNMIKGLTAGFVGISIGLIGFAPIGGVERFTFDSLALKSGIALLPLMMGLFAISQILMDIKGGGIKKDLNLKVVGLGISIKEVFKNGWNMTRSSLIGVGFGILPGLGGSVSNIVAYAQAKSSSKTPSKFGKGAPEGIYAAESANNASVGGALIPMLSLGIPGDTVTAILLGGLMIHGIQPGPLFMTNEPLIVNVIYVGFIISVLLIFVIQLFGMRLFPKILQVPQNYLYSILLVMTFIGAYAASNNIFDIWVMLFFGLIGYIMVNNNYPIAPLILGFVLGPMMETYLRRGMMSVESMTEFITRPISGLFIISALAVLVYTLYKELKDSRKQSVKKVALES